MTADFTTVMSEVPFSIPPSFALLGRAVVTLEGIALQGNSDYQLIMSSYPSVARRLLSGMATGGITPDHGVWLFRKICARWPAGGNDSSNDSSVRPLLKKALVDLLYDRNSGSQKLRTQRLYSLLAAACDLDSSEGKINTEQVCHGKRLKRERGEGGEKRIGFLLFSVHALPRPDCLYRL